MKKEILKKIKSRTKISNAGGVVLKSSFHFNDLKGAKVLFIDDIVTTGLTFQQMEEILLNRISDLVIYKFTLARVKLKNRMN